MKNRKTNKASALVVAVGMLAVLSAMAFTFVTLMRVEMDAGTSMQTMSQTQLLDNWALQRVVDRLIRTKCEGAMYTPVDWAGEEWYTRPLIKGSASFPLGSVMAFSEEFYGKGSYTIEARIIDCSSQINLSWATDGDAVKRIARLLACIPFRMDHAWNRDCKLIKVTDPDGLKTLGMKYNGDPNGFLTQSELEEIVKTIAKLKTENKLASKESILDVLIDNDRLKSQIQSTVPMTQQERQEKIAELFLGKRDMGGNILTVGWKDFITLDSWIDPNTVTPGLANQPRAPININTAPIWTLAAVFNTGQSESDWNTAWALAEKVVAYRTPKAYLPAKLRIYQDQMIERIALYTDEKFSSTQAAIDKENEDYHSDPVTEEQAKTQLNRIAHLLLNPSAETLKKQWEEIEPGPIDDEDLSADDIGESYDDMRLPRPFASWAQFDAFLKYLAVEGPDEGVFTDASFSSRREKAQAIMANCNPNTNYSRQPVRNLCTMWHCGKDQLSSQSATTELCFSTFGRYEAELVVGKGRVILAATFNGPKSPFSDDNYDELIAKDLDPTKIRTIAGSAFAPDRLYLYREDGKKYEIMTTRSVLDARTSPNRILLDRTVPEAIAKNTIRWEIQRLESIKKWNSIFKFADVVRIDNVADFWQSSQTTGVGDNALFFPQPDQKKQGISDSSDFTRDGAISMDTIELERDELGNVKDSSVHLYETFVNGVPQEGLLENTSGSVYADGRVFGSGIWLKSHLDGKLPIKFGFIDGPQRRGFFKNLKGTADKEVTVSMWICFNSDQTNGTILEAAGKEFISAPVRFSIVGNQLKAEFSGQPDAKTGAGGGKLAVEGISTKDWRAGRWYWIGFSYRETHQSSGGGIERGEAVLFAAAAKENYGSGDGHSMSKPIYEMELKVEQKTLPEGSTITLYSSTQDLKTSYVAMGPANVIVDEITVRHRFYNSEAAVKGIMPVSRYKRFHDSGQAAGGELRPVEYESPRFSLGYPDDVTVTYGTIAWTEHMTARSLRPQSPSGDSDVILGRHIDFSDATIELWRSRAVGAGESIGYSVGSINFKAEDNVKYDPLHEIPVWFGNEELNAGFDKVARIGRRGEGQRIAAPAEGDKPDTEKIRNGTVRWTGKIKGSDYYKNVDGTGSDRFTVRVSLAGPGDDPMKTYTNKNQISADVESPYIDDITITFFTPAQILYWRTSTDVVE